MVQITKEAVKAGKAVVIGLQSTGEAQSVKQALKRSIHEIGSTAFGVVSDVINYIPVPKESSESRQLARMLDEINNDIMNLKVHLPPNSLDQLINDLGGPERVAEMTGRKTHLVCDEYDSDSQEERNDSDLENCLPSASKKRKNKNKHVYNFEKRSATTQKSMNIDERNLFMNGEKQIAVKLIRNIF